MDKKFNTKKKKEQKVALLENKRGKWLILEDPVGMKVGEGVYF